MNATNTHTPGPWRIYRAGPRIAIETSEDVALVVAEANPTGFAAEREANARLIAAAPALLAFVERVSNTLRLDGTARNAALVTDAADLLRLARGS